MAEPPEDDPHISIVVPVKNVGRTVRGLLESLMRLDYDREKLEIIVVDGRSTDGTRKIVGEFPVTLIEEEGRGLNAARNTGIKYSRGEIVAFTDGDCVVPPDWARAIAENFRDPKVSFVGGLVVGYDREDLLSAYMDETFFQVTPAFRWRTETTDLNLLHFPAGANMAFRRQALEKVNLFDERIYYGFDDLEPVEDMSKRGYRIVLDPEVMVRHRHRTSLKGMLRQHFNYGRGGTLLLIYKRASQLARWFTTYLMSTTFAIAFLITMVASGLALRMPTLIYFVLGLWLLGFLFIQGYYLSIALRTKSLKKLFIYPVLDFARGFSFTFGGLTQLVLSLSHRVHRGA